MKQTAVEWLEFRYKNNINLMDYDFEQAKEMEKEQQGYSEEDLEKAFKVGFTLGYVEANDEKDKCFNRWFKIFKKK